MNTISPAVSRKIRGGAEGSNLLDARPTNTPESAKTPGAQVADSQHTSLYRYYDDNDVLLYVGITGRGIARNVEHNKSKMWWRYVDHQTVEHFATRHAAEAAERDVIRTFRPPFNKQYNDSHEQTRNSYLAVRAAVDSQPTNLLESYSLLGKCVPLAYLGSEKNRFVMATSLVHCRLVRAITLPEQPQGMEAGGARGKGRVSRIDKDGPLIIVRLNLLLHEDVDPEMPILGGSLRIKHNQSTKSFHPRRVDVVQNRIKEKGRGGRPIDAAFTRIAEQHRSIDAIAGDLR